MKEILIKTLSQMNKVFTSNEFSAKAKRNGVTQKQINSGILSAFLHNHAQQLETRRTWLKNQITEYSSPQKDEIKESINLLKKHGYKVYKPTTTFEEI